MSASVETPVPRAGARRSPGRVNVSTDTWELIWSYVHRVLTVNLGLAVANAPLLIALSVVDQQWWYPVFFGLLALGVGPSLAAAFGYLRVADTEGRASVGDFVRAYRRHFAASAVRWSAVVALVGVLVTDIVALHDSAWGAVLVPLLVVLTILVLAASVLALALLPIRPDLSLRAGLLVALYSAVRRGWLSLFSLALLIVALLAVNMAPLLALATVPGCVVIVVWANSGAALARVLDAPPSKS
jgi:uncharacterized membrane protein YesL